MAISAPQDWHARPAAAHLEKMMKSVHLLQARHMNPFSVAAPCEFHWMQNASNNGNMWQSARRIHAHREGDHDVCFSRLVSEVKDAERRS
jgi:hypothetical protein